MATNDDDSTTDPGPPVSNRWWGDEPAEWSADRRAEQVRVIVEAFASQDPPVDIGIYPSDDRPGDMEYLYVKGVVLTRDVDAERVNRALGRAEQW